MRLVFALLIFSSGLGAFCQKFNPAIESAINNLNGGVSYIQKFEEIGIKEPGSQQLEDTRNWLVNTYKSFGYDPILIDSFIYGGFNLQNVIVRKQGLSDEFLVVCSHYDTKSGVGANDNGTGVSATLQIAEVLANLTTNRSVVFIHFSAEEPGFIGSYHFVNNILSSIPGDLYAVINLDQIGGTVGEEGNDKIYCERDEITTPSENDALSSRITDTIFNLAKLYTNLTPVVSGVYSSDYIPFQEKGHVITGLYQYSRNPYVHTAADSAYRIDTFSFKEASKLAASGVIHFAQIPQFISVKDPEKNLFVTRNTSGNWVISVTDFKANHNVMTIFDALGRQVLERNIFQQSTVIDTDNLRAGVYFIYYQSQHSIGFVKVILNHP